MRKERVVVDARGVHWEIFREDEDALAAVLEWGHRPIAGHPTLIFTSSEGLRRFHPCPEDWHTLSDEQLLQMLDRASDMF